MAKARQGLLQLDGRQVSWLTVGPDDGMPVVYCHGVPGNRFETISSRYAPVWELGIRLIAIDRPGFGSSDPPMHPRHTGWADDVVAITGHLGVDSFGVMAGSGGTPWGTALATTLPDRVSALALVSPVGPYPSRRDRIAFGSRGRFGYSRPGLVMRSAVRRAVLSVAGGRAGLQPLPRHDSDLLDLGDVTDVNQLWKDELLRQGAASLEAEQRLGRSWDFPLDAITCPVKAWCGTKDPKAPIELMEPLRAIPRFELVPVEGDHGAPFTLAREQLTWLAEQHRSA